MKENKIKKRKKKKEQEEVEEKANARTTRQRVERGAKGERSEGNNGDFGVAGSCSLGHWLVTLGTRPLPYNFPAYPIDCNYKSLRPIHASLWPGTSYSVISSPCYSVAIYPTSSPLRQNVSRNIRRTSIK